VHLSGTNMLLEDLLAILGRVGTVTLRKGTNDISATPGHKANTDGWTCELNVSGYHRPFGHGAGGSPLYISGRHGSGAKPPRGASATEAARHCLEELERFLESDEARECRDCYLKWGNHRDGVAPEAKIEW
jgi:hypothetical protein